VGVFIVAQNDLKEMEATGESVWGFSKVKFNGRNATMRVSELRQIHQREVGNLSGWRSYNTATITQVEKHNVLMGLVKGEAYTALRTISGRSWTSTQWRGS
jgi:hypothetical protein